MTFKGKIFKEGSKLAEYNVTNESTIHLYERIWWGGMRIFVKNDEGKIITIDVEGGSIGIVKAKIQD